MFPKELLAIVDYINGLETLDLPSGSGDARRDSSDGEVKIIPLLQNADSLPRIVGENVGKNHNRNWCDFSVEINGIKHYVDIKISNMDKPAADNTNCISGIYYVLTGKVPPASNQGIISKIKDDMRSNDNDFYFLLINKSSNSRNLPTEDSNTPLLKSYLLSLRTLQEVKPNGNNLPFQCVWKNNLTPVKRNYEEMKAFLLSSYGESLRLRSKMYHEFKDCFPEFS